MTVTVLDQMEQPLPGVNVVLMPLGCSWALPSDNGLARTASGRTSEQGVAQMTLLLAEGEDCFEYSVSGLASPDTPAGLIYDNRDMTIQFFSENHLPNAMYVTVPAGANSASVQMQAKPGVVVSGRAVDINGQPVDAGVWVSESWAGLRGWTNQPMLGEFVAHGVAQNDSSVLFVRQKTNVKRLQLSAEQAADDVHLGDITIDPIDGDAGVRLSFQPLVAGWSVLLVSADGERAAAFSCVDGAMHFPPIPGGANTAWIKQGQYYVIPTSGPQDPAYDALFRAVALGIAPTVAGLPLIDAVDGQTVVLNFDGLAAREALLAAVAAHPE